MFFNRLAALSIWSNRSCISIKQVFFQALSHKNRTIPLILIRRVCRRLFQEVAVSFSYGIPIGNLIEVENTW